MFEVWIAVRWPGMTLNHGLHRGGTDGHPDEDRAQTFDLLNRWTLRDLTGLGLASERF